MSEAEERFPEARPATPVNTGLAETIAPPPGQGETSGLIRPEVTMADRQARQSWEYRFFVGPQGLRAGWSIFVFLAVFVLLSSLIWLALPPSVVFSTRAVPRPLTTIVTEGASLLAVLIATWIMARAEGRSLFFYGFSGPPSILRFFGGLLSGVAAVSALIAVLKFAGLIVFDGQMLHGSKAWEYGLKWAIGFLLVALTEESLLRGYLQFTLARGAGFWWAALLLSVGFGLLHLGNDGETPVGIFSAAAIGLVFCLSLWLTKSLWWAIGMHAGWDWAQSYVFGAADSGMVVAGHLYATHPVGALLWSGGPTGPEGSLYVIPVLLIVAAGAWLTLKPASRDTDLQCRKQLGRMRQSHLDAESTR